VQQHVQQQEAHLRRHTSAVGKGRKGVRHRMQRELPGSKVSMVDIKHMLDWLRAMRHLYV
jgi:hypothetical protein